MDEQNNNVQPTNDPAATTPEQGATTGSEPTQAIPAAGEPTQAMPATEQPASQPAPAAAQPTATQPMPPTGQPVQPDAAPDPITAHQNAVYNAEMGAYPQNQPSPTGALVCGILAIVFCFIPIVGIVLGIVAIVLAGKYFKAGGTQGQGKAGRICGIVGLVLSIVMIIINCILVFTALTALDEADVDVYDLYSTTTSSSSTYSSAATSGDIDADEQALFDVVNPEMDKLKNQDPTMVATVAAIMQESLDDALASEDLSLADLGVDPTAMAKSMLAGFDYEPDYAYVGSSSGDVTYSVTCKDTSSVLSEFEDALYDMLDDPTQFSTMEAAYQAIGKALMDAIDSTTPSANNYFDVDLDKDGSGWKLDQDSWTDELEYFFEF